MKIYRAVILPVVLHECQTFSLTHREEDELKVFQRSVTRRTFGPKGDEATGGWRKLFNKELRDLNPPPSIINRGVGYMDVVGALLPYRNATKIFLPIFDLEKVFHTSKY
jgi:hypothetical protein